MNPVKPAHHDVLQTVKDIVLKNGGKPLIPSFLTHMVDLFGQAHLYYRKFKQVRLFSRAAGHFSGGDPVIYGAALHLLSDYTSIGYVVTIALITKLAQDLLNRYRQMGQSYGSLQQAIQWQYPLYQPTIWRRGEESGLTILSPSLSLWGKAQVMGLITQILKIIRCATQVLWQAFQVSLCLHDARLLLEGNPQMRHEACTELIDEWNEYKTQLEKDYHRLLEKIQKDHSLADGILSSLNAPKPISFVIKTIEKHLGSFAEKGKSFLKGALKMHEEFLDPLYVRGKITPLHIDLGEGENFVPALPPGHFPPWAGHPHPNERT